MAKPELTVLECGKQGEALKPRAKTLNQAIADGDPLAELRALRALLGKRLQDPNAASRMRTEQGSAF